MKITVYAISKNESSFAERWMNSMKEADEIVVLDTGSEDGTAERLRSLGAKVETKVITPWRFDTARNESLDLAMRLVPDTDLLVCTDLDEYFLPGWREKLETAWKSAVESSARGDGPAPTTARYDYIWNFLPDGSDGVRFWYDKIHTPQSGARWRHPVHEILVYPKPRAFVAVDGIRLEHHADPAKSRASYLPLLELAVRETPDDDRDLHYLGREYTFHRRWHEAIDVLMRHLASPGANWDVERAQSMRFIAHSYAGLNNSVEAERWLWRAIFEAPGQREAAVELAELYFRMKEYRLLVKVCEIALSRNERAMNYTTEPKAWGFRPYDLYCLGLWGTGRVEEAYNALLKAIELAPGDERLKRNKASMDAFFSARDRGN